MSSSLKNEITSSDFEVDAQELLSHSRIRKINAIHTLRVYMTALALIASIAILGLSADTLSVYRDTHLPADFLLSLWPDKFDLRPTTALVAGSAIVTAANAVSLLASKSQSVRGRGIAHSSVSLVVPVVGFIAALVAIGLYYGVNTSTTVDTLQSWTCRWKSVPMMSRPQFGNLCKESQVALGLAILLVPLELLILVTAGLQSILERKTGPITNQRPVTRGSPALS